MVDLNFDRRRPEALLDLSPIPELKRIGRSEGHLEIGAGVTCTEIISRCANELPGLAMACRTIGSPQIRNRATLGGNLGTSSPAGDALPALLASDASLRLVRSTGARTVRVADFISSPGRNRLEPDELIESIQIPTAAGPQHFAKVGARNAMVIAIASFAIAIDTKNRRIGTGLGAVAPTPIAARAAEALVETELDWNTIGVEPPHHLVLLQFGDLVAAAASPIDDKRASADYRSHVVAVIARRSLTWTWMSPREGDTQCA